MSIFSNYNITLATNVDLPNIEHLLNIAYRGEESTKGWTTESHLITGNTRTTLANLQQTFCKEESVFLLYKKENVIVGCVNLQKHQTKIYLGMFAVEPQLQGGGVGKALLQAAEEWALHLSCTSIYMTVISVREELINWYNKYGYEDTGKRVPFEEDGISGTHLQQLEFMELEKLL